MTRCKRTLCALTLTIGISSSVFAGNIGGMRTNGNIGGLRTNAAGNIGGLRTNSTGNIGGMRTNSSFNLGNEQVPRHDAEFPVSDSIITLIRLLLQNPALF